MRVLVTAQTITEYGLDTLTGNSREDLLARVSEMKAEGYDMFINIPDVVGGDKDVPKERNVFEHYSEDLPEPEGIAHTQLALNLSYQADIHHTCNYRYIKLASGDMKWICNVHDVPSKHYIEEGSHVPCISVDPLGNHIWE